MIFIARFDENIHHLRISLKENNYIGLLNLKLWWRTLKGHVSKQKMTFKFDFSILPD